MTGCTARRYDQFETSPEAIEQELRPAVCERRQTDRLKANYSIDNDSDYFVLCMLERKEVCSTSHTKIERPTSESGRGQNS